MSSKKIIRLKTPGRGKDGFKCQQDLCEASGHLDQQTIMKGFRAETSENVYGALIEELNKAYQEMQKIKEILFDSEEVKQALIEENELLKERLEMLERQCQLEKEKYALERENHQRLREFYEKREREWMGMLCEQRRLVQYYDCRKGEELVKETHSLHKSGELQPQTTARTTNQQSHSSPFFYSRQGFQKRFSSKGLQSIPKSLSASKKRFSHGRNFFNIAHRIFQEETKSIKPQNSISHKQLNSIKEGEEHKANHHNRDSDEIFDKILRRTICRFREYGKSLADIQNSEEMIKLKKARTSTRQRLEKTIRKTHFEIQGDDQLKQFCDYIEHAVTSKHQQFRGDFVFIFLLQKLRECQTLALTSNSIINRMSEHQKSEVSISGVQNQGHEQSRQNDGRGTLIQELKSSNFDLLVMSKVKGENNINPEKNNPPINEPQISEVIRHQDSGSVHSLSDIINASRDYLQITRI